VDQLKDSNITWTLLGHSERRVILQEDNVFVANKTKAALDGGIGVILCVGESLEQREKNKTIEVVTSQLSAVKSLLMSPFGQLELERLPAHNKPRKSMQLSEIG
jgi:triosephosphate isomerase